jgi:hypothetical protein
VFNEPKTPLSTFFMRVSCGNGHHTFTDGERSGRFIAADDSQSEATREPIVQRQPQRKPTNQPTTNYFGADFIDPQEHQFDLLVAEAAKCSRVFSDNEILAAGFDVRAFRSALRDAVHDKVVHRTYRVGSVICDCSAGVCTCR